LTHCRKNYAPTLFSSIINTLHIVCLTHPSALFKTRPSWKHHCQSFLFFERTNAFLIGPSTPPEVVRHGAPTPSHCYWFLRFRRRNDTKSSKCLLNKWIGSTQKCRVPYIEKKNFQVPLLPQRVWIFEFLSECSSQNFNKRNLVNNYNTLLYICGNLNLHKNKYLNLVSLNELCFCRTLCPLKLWTPWRTTSRVLKAIKLTQVAKLNCRGSYLHTKVWK